ncbi:hypothetical protein P7K49_022588 [Saguinus oedipus]|uniref:Uncharacterized protein n=1 Tax=Saguinus oedipus TaxID=9490 RepID=A0ABQ9UJB6_SAGOE|nr:hypothetical protein P7K49_022588 [Saguinus oedipus]
MSSVPVLQVVKPSVVLTPQFLFHDQGQLTKELQQQHVKSAPFPMRVPEEGACKLARISQGPEAALSLTQPVNRKAAVYLLDDPLVALDAHIGQHVFNQVIGPGRLLQGTTLVTHALHILPQVDWIVVLADGAIVEMGSHQELAQEGGPHESSGSSQTARR